MNIPHLPSALRPPPTADAGTLAAFLDDCRLVQQEARLLREGSRALCLEASRLRAASQVERAGYAEQLARLKELCRHLSERRLATHAPLPLSEELCRDPELAALSRPSRRRPPG